MRNMYRWLGAWGFSLLACLLVAGAAGAKDQTTSTLYARAEGDVVRLALVVEIDPERKLYHKELGPEDAIGMPTSVDLRVEGEGAPAVTWSAVRFPQPFRLPQPGLGAGGKDTWIWAHRGRMVLYAAGRADRPIDPALIKATVEGLTCGKDHTCIPYFVELTPVGPGPDVIFDQFPKDLLESPAHTRSGAATGLGIETLDGTGIAASSAKPEAGSNASAGPLAILPFDESALRTSPPAVDSAAGTGVDGAPIPSGPGTPPGANGTAAAPAADSAANRAAARTAASEKPASDQATVGEGLPEFQPRGAAASHGLAVYLGLALLAGMLLNVMPCVLPVLSIRVLGMVQQAGESRARSLLLGGVFAAGVIAVFLVLGGLAVGTGLAWGQQFQSQTFVVVMVAVVFAFALSLFGVYEITLPGSVGAMAGGAPKTGLLYTFCTGALATVLATPCAGPFLGSTLAWALKQPPSVVMLVFLTMGVGMALPYFLLTAHPALVKRLPKPGAWMDGFKKAMGFLLVLTAVYLMQSIRQDWLLWTNLFLAFVAASCWIWGHYGRFGLPTGTRLRAGLAALLVVALGAWLAYAGLPRLLHPPVELAGARTGAVPTWRAYSPSVFLGAQRAGRNVVVKFTAAWCSNCKVNELRIFHDAEVLRALAAKGAVLFKVDLTRPNPEGRALLEHLSGGTAIPYTAFFPGDEPLRPYVRASLLGRGDVKEILASFPEPDSSKELTAASR